jgi:hypothetical protein
MAKEKSKKLSDTEGGLDLEFMGSRDETAEARTVTSRRRLRDKMHSDIETFLSHGGNIRHIDPHVTADPPRKPHNNYGGRPI